MPRNELVNYHIHFVRNYTRENIRQALTDTLGDITHVYSWILYDKKNEYLLSILVSETRVYNTLLVNNIADDILQALTQYHKTDKRKQVITHKQPPLEILCETYRPLVYSLCIQQHTYWPQIELEDLIQMCNLRICILYQQGYYIHKKLLNRAFANAVLVFLRPERYKPHIASLDEISDSKSGGDENVSPLEVIEDESASEEIQNAIDEMDGYTFEDLLSSEMRNVVLEFVSQRTYDQWKIEYGTKTVSRQTASQVNALKSKLSALGISRKSITDYIIRRR